MLSLGLYMTLVCTNVYIYICRLAWVDQKRRQVLYQRYIRAMQVLYQLPIKTSGEDSSIATNEAIRNFCGGYYRVDDINYLCHVRYGMFPRNKSRGPRARSALGPLDLLRGNIPNSRDIYIALVFISSLVCTNVYYSLGLYSIIIIALVCLYG